MLEYPFQRVRLTAPPGRDRREFEFFTKQMSRESGEKRHDRSRLDHAASECVCHFHIAGDDRVDEAGNSQKRIAAKFERIAKAIIHPAQNHINLFQPVDSLEIHAALADREISPLHQSESEIASDIRMFEISFVQWSWSQQYDAWIVTLSKSCERVTLRPKKRSEAQYVRGAKK